jgi:hypothetical protein
MMHGNVLTKRNLAIVSGRVVIVVVNAFLIFVSKAWIDITA